MGKCERSKGNSENHTIRHRRGRQHRVTRGKSGDYPATIDRTNAAAALDSLRDCVGLEQDTGRPASVQRVGMSSRNSTVSAPERQSRGFLCRLIFWIFPSAIEECKGVLVCDNPITLTTPAFNLDVLTPRPPLSLRVRTQVR